MHQCTLPHTVTGLLYTPLSVNFEKAYFAVDYSVVVPSLVLLLLSTKRRHNSVNNPSPKMPASWFDFSLKDNDFKIK